MRLFLRALLEKKTHAEILFYQMQMCLTFYYLQVLFFSIFRKKPDQHSSSTAVVFFDSGSNVVGYL